MVRTYRPEDQVGELGLVGEDWGTDSASDCEISATVSLTKRFTWSPDPR